MRKAIRQLFQLFTRPHDKVNHRTIKELVGIETLELLIDQNLLRPAGRSGKMLCSSCDDPHFLSVLYDSVDDQSYIFCSRTGNREGIDGADLIEYILDTINFLREVLRLLDIDIEDCLMKRSKNSHIIEIGSAEVEGIAHYLYFTHGLDSIEESDLDEMCTKNNPTLIFLANPLNQSLGMRVSSVPILSLIETLDEDGMVLDTVAQRTQFYTKEHVTGEHATELDEHVVLFPEDQRLCFQKIGKSKFQGEVMLDEPAIRMIEYLHTIRFQDKPYKSVKELAHIYASGHSSTISGYKRQVENAAKKNNTKKVIINYKRNSYQLNPNLDCYK